MMYRRILERCATAEAAVELVRATRRTCANSLAVADPEGEPIVIEFTPDAVAVRRPERGVLFATNHFRSLPPEPGGSRAFCERYIDLERFAARRLGRIDVAALQQMLRAVQMTEKRHRSSTLQSMVFEPAARRLHLSVGHLPAAEGTYVALDCAGLLAAK